MGYQKDLAGGIQPGQHVIVVTNNSPYVWMAKFARWDSAGFPIVSSIATEKEWLVMGVLLPGDQRLYSTLCNMGPEAWDLACGISLLIQERHRKEIGRS